ncbi:hypothetical protein ACFFGV_19885 [Pontibacillus salicampi]|uniref:Uncharacterized protein n=1 Tax=Pontibacillus salicampi TaxID=1449801 RepID=A0ABV6LTU8_9BACI
MKKIAVLLLSLFVLAATALPSTTLAKQPSSDHHQFLSKKMQAVSKKTYRYFEDFTVEETGLT